MFFVPPLLFLCRLFQNKRGPLCIYLYRAKLALLSTARKSPALNASKYRLNMEKKDWKTWLSRLGVAGFLFFFFKGLLWLAVFFGLLKVGCG